MMLWLLALSWAGPLDLNAATVEELAALPGMGPIKARALAEWREAYGPCTSVADAEAAPGIGPATVRGWNGAATCGEGTPAPLEPTAHPIPPIRRSSQVDLNRASAEELRLLPGMTAERADDLIRSRERDGDFARCDDAVRVHGIGPATVAAWGDRCVTP